MCDCFDLAVLSLSLSGALPLLNFCFCSFRTCFILNSLSPASTLDPAALVEVARTHPQQKGTDMMRSRCKRGQQRSSSPLQNGSTGGGVGGGGSGYQLRSPRASPQADESSSRSTPSKSPWTQPVNCSPNLPPFPPSPESPSSPETASESPVSVVSLFKQLLQCALHLMSNMAVLGRAYSSQMEKCGRMARSLDSVPMPKSRYVELHEMKELLGLLSTRQLTESDFNFADYPVIFGRRFLVFVYYCIKIMFFFPPRLARAKPQPRQE